MSSEKGIMSSEYIFRQLKGCCFTGDYHQWKLCRDIFVPHIKTAKSIMDLGCGNGFLLESLKLWSGTEFTPHGIDIVKSSIEDAQLLFPKHAENFSIIDMFTLEWTKKRYDVVLAPWIKNAMFLETIRMYLSKYPDSNVVFSVYDDEMGSLHDMVNYCNSNFQILSGPVIRPKLCAVITVQFKQ